MSQYPWFLKNLKLPDDSIWKIQLYELIVWEAIETSRFVMNRYEFRRKVSEILTSSEVPDLLFAGRVLMNPESMARIYRKPKSKRRMRHAIAVRLHSACRNYQELIQDLLMFVDRIEAEWYG